ncbi:MAG: flagellar basal body-associated FliL family protein [Rhodocyclaceae bacterium]|nr:flagellar basal body-associated FliL family protein [Rhodocyclaceae bacterium]
MAKAPPKKEDKKAEAEAEAEGEEPQPKKKGKLPLILGLVVLLAAGGGGAWFFMSRDKGTESAPQQTKLQPPKPPVFVPLDAFTVNLSTEQGDQYLQVAATLKVLDQFAADAAKQYMPEVRHKMLVLLSTKKALEITTGEGRERLAEEIRQTANNVLLAAAGRPTKPIVLDVPREGDDAPPVDEDEAKAENAAEAPKPEEGAPGTVANAPPATPPAAATPVVAEARLPTMLSKAAADDLVQSVFFTSFIIQ